MTNNMKHDIRMLPISQIKIGDRHRKDLGDLATSLPVSRKGFYSQSGSRPRWS